MNRWRIAVPMFLALALVGAACGDDGSESSAGSSTTTPGDDPGTTDGGGDPGTTTDRDASAGEECTEDRVGGSITFALQSLPPGLDPVVTAGGGIAGGNEVTALYDTLMRYDIDRGEFVPFLAESVEPNEDFSEWTVTLPDGVTFSNGDPLTADVVKASVERHFSEENITLSRSDVVNTIDEMTVVDPLTVRFTLQEPWRGFPFILANKPGMITNPNAVEAAGEAFATEVPSESGVGPYELVRYIADEEIVMRAKEDYWDGPVCIEELRFVHVPGAEATYEAFQNGELQVMLIDEPGAMAQAHADGVEGYSSFIHLGAMLLMNSGIGDSSPATADVRVRQAVAAAIDPEVIDERVSDGTTHPTGAIFGNESQRGGEFSGPELDPDRAGELVEEVKADTGWDGSIRLTCHSTPDPRETCITIKAMLDAVGFDTSIESVTGVPDMIQRVIVNQDYDIADWSMSVHDEAPWRGLSQFYSDSTTNRSGYGNPEMDSALDDLKAAGSVEEENEVLGRIQEIWNETVPSVKYSSREHFVGWADDLVGVQPNGDGMVSLDDAYLVD